MPEHSDFPDGAQLYIDVLRMVAARSGHTSDRDSLHWAVAQRYIQIVPATHEGADNLCVVTPKGLELVDEILLHGGRRVALDGAGSFRRITDT